MTEELTLVIGSPFSAFTFAPVIEDQERIDPTLFKNLSNFFVAGINYKKSDASLRGNFAIDETRYEAILRTASLQGLDEVFILSTCNRTEIYGFAYCSHQLIDLLCSQTKGSASQFTSAAYIMNGKEAIEHLFSVGSGLDSQILGDYEIVGQLKTAARFAKTKGFIGSFSERLVNAVLQASKQVKNETNLSGGTVSVSFAAVQYIKKNIEDCRNKKILLLGTGKIGKNTCMNLVDYLQNKNITLINRTSAKAESLATSLGLNWAPQEALLEEVKKADIILVATNSQQPVILSSHLNDGKDRLIIDLSIPCNVDPSSAILSNIHLVNVDLLSKYKDETLKQRLGEVPKAKRIISEVVFEFMEWCDMRRHVPMLKDLKVKLKDIHHKVTIEEIKCHKTLDVQIQRVINDTAGKIKEQNQKGCQYISALNQFITSRN